MIARTVAVWLALLALLTVLSVVTVGPSLCETVPHVGTVCEVHHP